MDIITSSPNEKSTDLNENNIFFNNENNDNSNLIINNDLTKTVDYDDLVNIIVFFLNVFASRFLFILAIYSQNLLSIYFLSNKYNNPDIINAVGLVHVYSYILSVSFVTFVVTTFNLVGPIAFGDKDYINFGYHMHRSFILVFLIWSILYIIHFFTSANIMLLLGLSVYQYEYFDIYIKLFLIATCLLNFHAIFVSYLNIIDKSWVTIIIMAFGFCLHIIFCYVFIHILDYGVVGAGCAAILTYLIAFLMDFSYIMIFMPHPESIFFFTMESFEIKEIWEFLKIYFSIIPIGICMHWSQHIQSLVAFSLPKIYLESHVILQTIVSELYAIPVASAFSGLVSNGVYIGRKEVHKVKIVFYVTQVCSNTLMILIVILLIILRNEIISLFIKDHFVVIEISLNALPPLCVFLIFQSNNYNFEYMFRVCGYRLINIIVPIAGYFILMLGLSLIFTKVLTLNVLGIWISSACSEITIVLVYLIAFFVFDIEASIEDVIKQMEIRKNAKKKN